jgi:ATP adenylyltransferase
MVEHLWAPWRMEYIEPQGGRRPGGCFLCELFAQQDVPTSMLIHRGQNCGIVMNRFPYNSGHLMVVPIRHAASLEDLTAEEHAEMSRLVVTSIRLLRETSRPEGFNIGVNLGGAAGAGLKDHVHTHVVPRWNGDTNFMPVLGDIRVIPESLERMREKLMRALAAMET